MNWGNRLLLVFIVFGAGMFYLVYRSVNTDFEMVEKDYYKQELRYQQVINDHEEANKLSSSIQFSQQEALLRMQLPEEMKNKSLTGEVYFYCAYDSKKDKRFELKTDSLAIQQFLTSVVTPGTYTVKVKWKDGDQSYYSEKTISVL
ncbi:MAG: FixH family protein [Chitinophagaceae bacterium]|nr:FixH family protein [Chitinophagaceae bacterium]